MRFKQNSLEISSQLFYVLNIKNITVIHNKLNIIILINFLKTSLNYLHNIKQILFSKSYLINNYFFLYNKLITKVCEEINFICNFLINYFFHTSLNENYRLLF